jgi:hypothetical protein
VHDENGRRLVVRNGSAQPRTVVTSAGAVEVTAPRVNDKRTDPDTGQRMRFSSAAVGRGDVEAGDPGPARGRTVVVSIPAVLDLSGP